MKPRLKVWVAPTREENTLRCVRTLLREGDKALWLLPSEIQAQMARALLMAEGVPENRARKTVGSFQEFALDIARHSASFSPVPPYWRGWLLRVAARQLAPSLCDREGMLQLLSAWAREVTKERITAHQLQQMASSSPEPEKVATLAQLLEEYQRLLEARDWSEEEEVYAAAAQALATGAPSDLPRTILLDGFAHFSRAETDYLHALALRGVLVVVVLAWQEGRKTLFEQTEQTLQWLGQCFEVVLEPLQEPISEGKPAAISLLANRLFSEPTEVLECDTTESAVEIWEAPNQLSEVELIAREIVRAHRRGIAWGEIAVFCRNLSGVLPALVAVFERFNIPYQHFVPQPLGAHPMIQTLVVLLRMAEQDYPRDSMIRCLKSGYIPVDLLEADTIRRLAVRAGVRSGASSWERIARKAEEEGLTSGALVKTIIEQTRAIQQAATPRQWLQQIQEAVQAIGFGVSYPQGDEPLSRAMEVARQAVGLLRGEEGDASVWLEVLAQAWDAVALPQQSTLRNAVWLLEATGDYPLRPRLAFVMGMQEGRFPRRIMEDPLLRDVERQWLNHYAGARFLLSRHHTALERLAFYHTVTCARQRVILTYSRTEGEHDVLPSFYLQAVREVLPPSAINQRSIRLSDVTVSLEEALGEEEIERTLVDALFDTNPHTRRPLTSEQRQRLAETICQWLHEKPQRCQQWWRWRYLPPFPRLNRHRPSLSLRTFSASELEQLQQCPFRHFMRWEMKLHEESIHYAAGQGRWLHAILHRRLQQPEQPLAEIARQVAQQHPLDRPLGEQRLLLQQVEEIAQSVIQREEQIYSAFGLQIFKTEMTFGPAPDAEEQILDLSAPPLHLTLPNRDRVAICGRIDRVDVCPNTGMAVLLDYKRNLPRNWWEQVQTGEDIQTVLYVAALRQVWKLTPVAVALDDALEAKRYRLLFLDSAPADVIKRLGRQSQEDYSVVQQVQGERWRSIERKVAQRVHQLLQRLQSGDIRPAPGEHCTLCEYAGVCRTISAGGVPFHDGEPYPQAEG